MDIGEAVVRVQAICPDFDASWAETSGRERWLAVSGGDLTALVEALLGGTDWAHLSTITAQVRDDRIEILYHLWLGWGLTLRVLCSRESPHLPSICAIAPVADWYEREVHDMYGVVFDGHPGLAPLLIPPDMAPPMLLEDEETAP